MAFEAENVKNATHIRLYCHLSGYMDGDLKPIPVTLKIVEFVPEMFSDIATTNFLEYNKITLKDKNEHFQFPQNVLSFKIPEYCGYIHDLGFAFKAFLPPHLEKIEFLDGDGLSANILYTKYFSIYNDENVLVSPDKTYSKWFVYSIAQKIILDEEEISEETYCFEYALHTTDTKAHTKDLVTLPMQLDNRSLAIKDSIYYSLYNTEREDDQIQVKSQVVNGNLITNNYRLFYLGNNIYDGTDEVNTVAAWANNIRNASLIFLQGDIETPCSFIQPEFITFCANLVDPNAPTDLGTLNITTPTWGAPTRYLLGNGGLDTTTNRPAPLTTYTTGIMYSDNTVGQNDAILLGDIMDGNPV